MFDPFEVTHEVLRFDGPDGWFYVPFDEATSAELRPLVTATWPALLKVDAQVRGHRWRATVMPIKEGPLFVALPAAVRKRTGVQAGDRVTVTVMPIAG